MESGGGGCGGFVGTLVGGVLSEPNESATHLTPMRPQNHSYLRSIIVAATKDIVIGIQSRV